MDSAHIHGRSSSSPSSVPGLANRGVPFQQYRSPSPAEHISSRQQRLIESRNAKFVRKRLSLNDLSTRFTQLIHAKEEPKVEHPAMRNQENITPKKQNIGRSPGKRKSSIRSPGILEEVSNTTITQGLRKRGSIPVYLDNPERSLVDLSADSSPAAATYDISSEGPSPIGFDNFQDSLNKMHLREVSGNEQRGSPMMSSPLAGSMRAVRKRRSMPFKPAFDSQEYINHIEQELQQARKELYSPTSNKSLKDQLKSSRSENDRLKHEIASVRDEFESEVKHTVEHMMAIEAELKMKVKDLEEELETKNHIIRDFEHKHEDERLDCNTVDTLKAAIERLEQEKTAMENENRGMSRRNEVLSELLAMSPTKSHAMFELKSPVREKRPGRPMSMILPRLPSSPTFKLTNRPQSVMMMSPSMSIPDYFQIPVQRKDSWRKYSGSQEGVEPHQSPGSLYRSLSRHSQDEDAISTVSGTRSQTSSSPAPWSLALPPSPAAETAPKLFPKRKPRKFMAGSTQLKPLLLPALAGEAHGQHTVPTLASPKSIASRDFSQESFDPTTYFLSQPEVRTEEIGQLEVLPEEQTMLSQRYSDTSAHYQTFDEILAEHEKSMSSNLAENDGLALQMPSSPSFVTLNEARDEATSEINTSSPSPPQYVRHISSATHSAPHCSHIHEAEPDRSGRRPSFTQIPRPQLDLDTLDRFELPMTDFSPLPQQSVGDDDCLLIDIPQPLFSPAPRASPANRIFHHLRSVPVDESPRRLTSRKRRSSITTMDSGRRSSISSGPGPCIASQASESKHSLAFSQVKTTSIPPYGQGMQLAPPCGSKPFARSRSPLDLLQQRQFGARPLASLTIRTIYGTISRCTSYIREFKRDPLALARRIIANAWFSNWARFGKLSWWVLGLFISPVNLQKNLGWQWHQYDGDGIAQAVCDGSEIPAPEPYSQKPGTSASCNQEARNMNSDKKRSANKPGWGKSLLLWGKFSIAIMLAVGGAVVNGPGEMLQERDNQGDHEAAHADCSRSCHAGKCCQPSCSTNRPGKKDRLTTREHRSRKRAKDYSTSTVPPEPEGHDFLDQTQRAHSFTFRSGQQLDAQIQTDSLDQREDNDTLRPGKTQRVHAADVFRLAGPAGYDSNSGSVNELGLHIRTQSEARSVDSGTLQWPPSPGMICSDQRDLSGSR